MQIFKFIKEKIKLIKKTKEERINLLISGKNTLYEASPRLKYKILGSGIFAFMLALLVPTLLFMFITLSHLAFISDILVFEFLEQHGDNIPFIALLITLAIFPLTFHILLKDLDKEELLYGLFENAKLSYLTKNAKQINNYLLENDSATVIHEFINHHDFLCADIDNIDIFFNYLKSKQNLVFEQFYKIRKTLINKKETLLLDKLDIIYNDRFLNDDLDHYISCGRSDFDKDILNYLNVYGCRTDIHTHFKNKNSKTEPVKSIENKANNTIDFDLFNKKANVYANF